jgi:hypothetical protein
MSGGIVVVRRASIGIIVASLGLAGALVAYPAGAKPAGTHDAQKLAKALKNCRKYKPKSKRGRCEKTAKAKYESKTKTGGHKATGDGTGMTTGTTIGTTTGTGTTTDTGATTGTTTGTTGTSTGTIPENVRAELLDEALKLAARDGDSDPSDIQAVLTTVEGFEKAIGGGTKSPSCEALPECATWPIYLVAMSGDFAFTGSLPAGAKATGPFTVLTFTRPAKEPTPKYLLDSFGESDRYPDLAEAGVPVALGPQ